MIHPLIEAIDNDQKEKVLSILSADEALANKILRSDIGYTTPLLFAVSRENLNIVNMLLNQFRVDPSKGLPSDSETPLSRATGDGNVEIVSVLLKAGANIVKTGAGAPLPIAAYRGYSNIIDTLVEASSFTQHELNYALGEAAYFGRQACATSLLKAGASLTPNEEGVCPPLFWAAYREQVGMIKFLVDQGASAGPFERIWPSKEDPPYLFMGMEKFNPAVAEALLAGGVSLETRSQLGYSVLHEAASSGNLEAVKFYIAKGVSPNLPISELDQRSPLDIAKEHAHDHIVSYLESLPQQQPTHAPTVFAPGFFSSHSTHPGSSIASGCIIR